MKGLFGEKHLNLNEQKYTIDSVTELDCYFENMYYIHLCLHNIYKTLVHV